MFLFGIPLRCSVWSGVNGGPKWTGRAAGGVCKARTHGAPASCLQDQVCRKGAIIVACSGMAYHDTLRHREGCKNIDMAYYADLWPASLLRKSLLKLMRRLGRLGGDQEQLPLLFSKRQFFVVFCLQHVKTSVAQISILTPAASSQCLSEYAWFVYGSEEGIADQ